MTVKLMRKSVFNVIYAEAKTSFGINGGLAIPTGNTSDTHKIGFSFGAIVNFATSSPTVGFTLGASYIRLSGKTETVSYSGPGYSYSFTIDYESADLFSIFAGPQIGKEKGPYFLPAITANFDEWGESRFGLEIGGGILVPFGSGNTKFNISATYSLLNLIGKEEG